MASIGNAQYFICGTLDDKNEPSIAIYHDPVIDINFAWEVLEQAGDEMVKFQNCVTVKKM